LLRGQLALMQGRPADAIRLLKESIGSREDRHGAPALSASLGIARAFQRSGDVEQAVHVLEEASQNRYTGCLWPAANAYLWVQLRYDLAELYRRVGRDTDADAIGSQLRTVLALADEDHLVKARVGRDAVRTDDMKPMFE
jgi:hypothetical protein